jgi:hypothetical protein
MHLGALSLRSRVLCEGADVSLERSNGEGGGGLLGTLNSTATGERLTGRKIPPIIDPEIHAVGSRKKNVRGYATRRTF